MKTHSKRYDRQIALPEIGISGQQKLAEGKVLIVGAGGLGCPVLQNLAAAGLGHIAIVDGDIVEETNLHRQFLYTLNDCGKNKAIVAAETVLKQNPEVEIIPYPTHFNKENAFEIVADYEIIVDCTDDLETRYLINDVSLVKAIPMVYASIHKFEGQLSVLNYKNGPSYRCLFPQNEKIESISNCNDSGVLGVLPNVLGTLQAAEVLKIILGIGEILNGKLLLFDGLSNQFQNIYFKTNESQKKIGVQKGKSILNNKIRQEKTITAVDFFDIISKENSLIIDIREIYEEPDLDIENMNRIPLSQLEYFLKEYDKNQEIILICSRGNRSKSAAEYLVKCGFNNISHLQNGIESLDLTAYKNDR